MKDKFLLEKAYLGWGIPTFVLNGKNQIRYQKCGGDIPVNMDAAAEVRKRWRESQVPVLWYETMDIIHMGFEDEDGDLCLFGPISIGNLSRAQIRDYQFTHKWKNEAPFCRILVHQAVSCLSTMYFLLTGRKVSEEVLTEKMGTVREPTQEDAWDFMDDYDVFFGYEQERAFIEEFKQGEMRIDEKTLLENSNSLEFVAPLARQNYIKNSEYAAASAISIMRKAAIEAGVTEEICYRLSFQYYKRLAGCTSTIEMMRVYADAANELGRRIGEVKKKGNVGELPERCKRYIVRNIRRKFTIDEMAKELGYHPGYLSRLFTQKEGISLRQYILKERLYLAANILKNSDEKIGVISDYLCFHSQSYMTEQFVKEYGMTPKEYRRKNKL